MGQLWALVPMKALGLAKSRLAACLGTQRRDLALAMFRDVSARLLASRAFAGVAVVTDDPVIRDLAAARGIRVIDESGQGMNEAIRQGVGALLENGAKGVAIIPADVPLITESEIRRVMSVLDQGRLRAQGSVVGILPNRECDGTNFLSIEGLRSFPFAYGPGSFQRHLQSTAMAGHAIVRLESAEFGLDIDDESDLRALVDVYRSDLRYHHSETWKLLRLLGVADAEPEPQCVINE